MVGTHQEVIVEGGAEGFHQDIQVGKHRLAGDEPVDQGGTDSGPNPYDLLLAALGTCTSMTLRMYANHKKWPLQGVRVMLKHDRIHAEDCEDCESEKGFVDIIQRKIELKGDLTTEQRERLKDIANKCPVHKTLTTETKIRTELV